jgi:pilus assembly protein FimV
MSLVLVFLLSSEIWALGLGDIRMESALNEPLNARIELLSATPEELDNLTIAMASADTFQRYGIDRPFYLQDIQFNIVRSGRADGNYVQVRSGAPMAEPFLTFLVEASWSRGRLLREYTVFLDPPTFAPPAADTAPAVQAPTRTAPSDSGRIERSTPPPAQQQRPAPRPAPAPRQADSQPESQPEPAPARPAPADFADIPGGEYTVLRGDTLWGLASRIRPDFRLTMNQTMLAIFEANPEAFGGNINILRAGAAIRIPNADAIFEIDRGMALAEAQRQNAEWSGGTVPAVADTSTRPSLTLVPPDEDFTDEGDTLAPEPDPEPLVDEATDAEPTSREQEIEARIDELLSADVPQQQSLIEIRDNELAQLREELARIRGEVYEPVIDESLAEGPDETIDDAELVTDETTDEITDATTDATPTEADTAAPTNVISTTTRDEPGLIDQLIEYATGIYGLIAAAVVIVLGLLVWFMRRGRDEDDIEEWQPLDKDEMAADISATESLRAPAQDESIMVVEQGPEPSIGSLDETVDAPAFGAEPTEEVPAVAEVEDEVDSTSATGQFGSLEDTFSSETAINLDQSDPIAEADFHMAYGLYDQAADLINGALSVEPDRSDLLTKLCEIYFVWGNRDAFIDAAGRLKSSVGDGESADWDKIVIMGQQIAADDELFAGASAAGATKAVDLSFDEGGDETGALDMEFGAEDGGADIVDLGGAAEDEIIDLASGADEDVFDLSGAEEEPDAAEESAVDFVLDETSEETVLAEAEETAESPTMESADLDITREMPASDETAEMPEMDDTVEAASDETAETPTIEQQFDVLSGTAELPSLDDTLGDAIQGSGQSADETAEINLDDLGLDVDSMAETELASLDDLDATGQMEALDEGADLTEVTGKNPEIDPDATGLQEALSGVEDTGINESLSSTGIEAPEDSLLDATGLTQVLGSDMAVETTTDAEADAAAEGGATMLATTLGAEPLEEGLPDDAETLLASLDDDADEADFDFAKTEALPKDAFTGDFAMDETGEMPAVASTDVELDLDDLTAALEVSDGGDTVEQPRDDATVEQPRPTMPKEDPGTVNLAPDDMSDELSEARTMTEVGTKLDLARAYVDMGDPAGARSILEEVLDEGDDGQRQQAQQLLDSLPS